METTDPEKRPHPRIHSRTALRMGTVGLALLSAFLPATSPAADVTVCRDASGTPIFTQHQCPPHSQPQARLRYREASPVHSTPLGDRQRRIPENVDGVDKGTGDDPGPSRRRER